MSVAYTTIQSRVLFEMNAVTGADAATLATNYASPSNTVVVADYPLAAVQDAILDAEAEIVEAICLTPKHPERMDFISVTAGLTSGSQIPAANGSSVKFVGCYGAVRDASDSTALVDLTAALGGDEEAALEQIRAFVANPNSMYSNVSVYWYVVRGNYIYHTRTSVVVEIPAFARSTFSGNIRIRDHHANALVSRAVSRLLREDMFPADKRRHAEYSDGYLAAIRAYGSPTQKN